MKNILFFFISFFGLISCTTEDAAVIPPDEDLSLIYY